LVSKNKLQDTIVVKFGGSVLEDEVAIDRAASLVSAKLRQGLGVVAVVSALKGATDDLLNLSKKVSPKLDPSLVDDLLSIGERTSARLLSAALGSRGVRTVVVDPDSPIWPVITDGSHLDANPDIEMSKQLVRKNIAPLVEKGYVPVICGFLGRTADGKVTTLGRGGSDTTAVLLGGCLGAREVILIKDVDGVFSSDPDQVSNPRFIENLTGSEAGLLASGGAKFLHAKALRYLSRGVKIRVTSLERSDSGTVIEDDLSDVDVDVSSVEVSMLTVVGVDPNRTESTSSISKAVKRAGGRVISMSLEGRAAIFYVAGGKNVLERLHKALVGRRVAKAVSIFEGLTMVTVKGRALETEPGIVQRVTQPLAKHKINLYGVVTILSSVRVFVSKEQSQKALSLVREAMGVR
jgi:aspartate kinase